MGNHSPSARRRRGRQDAEFGKTEADNPFKGYFGMTYGEDWLDGFRERKAELDWQAREEQVKATRYVHLDAVDRIEAELQDVLAIPDAAAKIRELIEAILDERKRDQEEREYEQRMGDDL